MLHKALGSARALNSLGPEAPADFDLIGVNTALPCGRKGRIRLLKLAVMGDVLGLSAVI